MIRPIVQDIAQDCCDKGRCNCNICCHSDKTLRRQEQNYWTSRSSTGYCSRKVPSPDCIIRF